MRLGALLLCVAALVRGADNEFLRLDAKRASTTGLSMRVNGEVGRNFDLRVISTDRSINYKLRATWMTPEAIRACARLEQLSKGLTDAEAVRLAAEAERAGDTVILVELDPREGSGVIPRDWTATLSARPQPDKASKVSRGANVPALRELPALRGFGRRDYAYEIFWIVFNLHVDGESLFGDEREAELLVRVYDKVGRVRWPIPESIRTKAQAIGGKSSR